MKGFAIEFRSGSYLAKCEADHGAPLRHARVFTSKAAAETFLRENEWALYCGGMVVEVEARIELHATKLGGDGADEPDEPMKCCPRFTWGDGAHDHGCRGHNNGANMTDDAKRTPPYEDGFICGTGLDDPEGARWDRVVYATREQAIAAGPDGITRDDGSFETAAISCRKEFMPCPISVESACDQADNDEWGEALLENWQDRVFADACAFMPELQAAIEELWSKLEDKHELWEWAIWFDDVQHHDAAPALDGVVKRATFAASDLVCIESVHRWYVCIGCRDVIDLGPDSPPKSHAPRCERCGDLGAPCNPDADPRSPAPPGAS